VSSNVVKVSSDVYRVLTDQKSRTNKHVLCRTQDTVSETYGIALIFHILYNGSLPNE
jgi:hypothetical protein